MSKPDHIVLWRGVSIRIRQVATGGYWAKKQPLPNYPNVDAGSVFHPKLSRYELSHNGRYLWSDTNWKRARKWARHFADKIANRKAITNGE